MKKIGIIVLAILLAFSAAGCGRRNNENNTTTPTSTPATTAPATTAPATTSPTVMPDMPEIETNIPDPTVNDNSTGDSTDSTDTTSTTQDSHTTRGRHMGK